MGSGGETWEMGGETEDEEMRRVIGKYRGDGAAGEKKGGAHMARVCMRREAIVHR